MKRKPYELLYIVWKTEVENAKVAIFKLLMTTIFISFV